MSIRLMSQVWDLDLPPGEKMTLLAMADWANDDGTSIYPSQARLAAKTGQSDRTIRRHLSDFEEAGVLERVGTAGRRNQIIEWVMHLHVLGTPDTMSATPDTVSDLSIIEPPEEPKSEDPPTSDLRVTDADTTDIGNILTPMNELVMRFGTPDKRSTWARYQKIVNLAKGHPPGEITRRCRNHSAGLGFALTIGSLEKRWDELGGEAAALNTLSLKDRQAMAKEQRRAEVWAARFAEEQGGLA